MIISVKRKVGSPFAGDEYCINLDRPFDGYEKGDIIIHGTPFTTLPLELELAIRQNGSLAFRSWDWVYGTNRYFHIPDWQRKDLQPTDAQCDTVAGLFSGRIKFEGLKIEVGGTTQQVCPIDLEREEARIGKTIYLA